jgi:hypothetical protein
MSIPAGDLNAKHPVWNSKVAYPSGVKFLKLLVLTSKFQLHNALAEVMFSTMYYIGTSDCHTSFSLTSLAHITYELCLALRTLLEWASDPVEKLTHWELIQSHASKFTPPNIQIHPSNEVDKAAHDFAASIASSYRLPTINTQFYTWNTKYMA